MNEELLQGARAEHGHFPRALQQTGNDMFACWKQMADGEVELPKLGMGGGQFQDAAGAAGCKLCPVGTHQSATVQASCAACPRGFYADEEGFALCLVRAVGQVAD